MSTSNSAVFGSHDEKTIAQFEDVASRAAYAALLPDGHLGYVMPIGGVAAYRNLVSPVGVGFDIGCGNLAVRTSVSLSDLEASSRTLQDLAGDIYSRLSFGVGLTNTSEHAPGPTFASRADAGWDALEAVGAPMQQLRAVAANQLGTIGGGNHYVDVFTDEIGIIWVGAHFGSRGFGHKIASGFMALSQGQPWGTRVPEREDLLSLASELGSAYMAAMNLAGQYAHEGREWVVRHVVETVLGATIEDSVHNHHNFAWLEQHYGEELVVIRKGATPAFPGQRGFVGGSMGDNAVILSGAKDLTGSDAHTQARALYSTVHGAGRVMGRMQAKGKWKNGVQIRPGLITHDDMRAWLDRTGVIVRGGDLDEAPQAYRRLHDVLKDAPAINIWHQLTPLIVCMAPGDTLDPYKD
jgi:tRNA-splicing ligase RtcB (3'-phosphate/5'-hydroxy nucleic acid ligase)